MVSKNYWAFKTIKYTTYIFSMCRSLAVYIFLVTMPNHLYKKPFNFWGSNPYLFHKAI